MKKLSTVSVLVFLIAITPAIAFAQKGAGSSGNGQKDQLQVQDPSTHDGTEMPQGSGAQDGSGNQGVGNAVQNNNKQSTQDQGGGSNLKIMNQDGTGIGSQGANKPSNRSGTARGKISTVAGKVEELLAQGERGIGQKVRKFAQEQKRIQENVEGQYNKLKSRNKFMKALIGPNQKALGETKKLLNQNENRIEKLQNLLDTELTEDENSQVQELLDSLVEQNSALESDIKLEENTTSLFGIFRNLFK